MVSAVIVVAFNLIADCSRVLDTGSGMLI